MYFILKKFKMRGSDSGDTIHTDSERSDNSDSEGRFADFIDDDSLEKVITRAEISRQHCTREEKEAEGGGGRGGRGR